MTYHTCTLLTTVSSRDQVSIREVMAVHTAAYKTHTQTHSVSLQVTEPTHTSLLKQIKETHLDKLGSRYWVEERLGFYIGCYTAPSHSEPDPPGGRRETINTDEL